MVSGASTTIQIWTLRILRNLSKRCLLRGHFLPAYSDQCIRNPFEILFPGSGKRCQNSELAQTMVIGYHLEGPFLSPEEGSRGCHPAEVMRGADLDYFEQLQEAAGGMIRLVTVAPEIEGAFSFIEQLSSKGIIVALGHTSAGIELIRQATDCGAVLSTHLGNGTASMLSKHDNPILAQLSEDRLSASFITDGYHSREQLRFTCRAKARTERFCH